MLGHKGGGGGEIQMDPLLILISGSQNTTRLTDSLWNILPDELHFGVQFGLGGF